MPEAGANVPPRRWKLALGRVLDTSGFTVDEWQHEAMAPHREALVAAIAHILERLQLEKTQGDLLERDTLDEDWQPWLEQNYPGEAAALGEADPVGAAYGLRWCEVLLDRQIDVHELLTHPPEAVVAWTRDVT